MKNKYTLKFKSKAVARVVAGERCATVAKVLGISSGMLWMWQKKLGSEMQQKCTISKDVIVFLRHACTAHEGKKHQRADLLVRLALDTLEGGK